MEHPMERVHLLAAEIFAYSYANYADHLGVNARFDRLMPDDVRLLEQAARERWPVSELARRMDVSEEQATTAVAAYRRALEVVDAANPAESFRVATRQCIEAALEEGLEGADAVERLVVQICYRAADLAWLLEAEQSSLSEYTKTLRR